GFAPESIGPVVRPRGEAGRAGFRVPLPVVDDPAAAGTRVSGLATAVGSLSRGALTAVPVTGSWTTESLFDLLVGLWDVPRVAVIARVDGAAGGAPAPRRGRRGPGEEAT
ncbi:DUF6885 family protein, partial [Amycolatopsis solani]|uniref:DUF6885 family protein n=1 Tax=Amycolatopsis solani TaxID=3028615 RepID=UPI003F6919D8